MGNCNKMVHFLSLATKLLHIIYHNVLYNKVVPVVNCVTKSSYIIV